MYAPSELSVCVTSNLLPIKCNGAQRYRRDYASNSLGALHREFESSPSNCGLSEHTHTHTLPHPQSEPLPFAVSAWEGGGHRRCVEPSDTPRQSHVRSDSSRCKMRVIPPSRFTPLSLSFSHHRRVNRLR